jgi:hypothetical protein
MKIETVAADLTTEEADSTKTVRGDEYLKASDTSALRSH